MRRARVALFALALVGAATTAAAQQQTAPGQEQSQNQSAQPAARPALKLRLDQIDDKQRRAIVGAEPRPSDAKPDAAQKLPGLGGNASPAWEAVPGSAIPKDQSPY
jgi:hypothetical protein